MPIKPCFPVLKFPMDAVALLGRAYPYNTMNYRDLREETKAFLTKNFAHVPDAQVITISQHNGKGRQWGVIFLRENGESEWQLVAQFGHRLATPFIAWITRWRLDHGIPIRSARARERPYRNSTVDHPRRLKGLLIPG